MILFRLSAYREEAHPVARFLLKPVDQEMLRAALASLIAPAGAQYSPGIA